MKLAMWLLRTFDVPSRNDALIGDLAEERAAGRSLMWLWAQTFAAIAHTVARDLRDHWFLAGRAIATGWAGILLGAWMFNRFSWHNWPDFVMYTLFLLIWPMSLGWIVAETHRTKRATMVLAFAAPVAPYSPWRFDPSPIFACSGILGILIGGFLPRLRKSLLERAKA